MVNYNMNGPTRDQVLKFMEEKDRIEREIQELNLVLDTNHVGMQDTLVDADGYPRNDVDVYRVRHARHRIICLQNDHKEIMKQIERGLHTLHAEFVGPQGEGSSHNRTHIEAMDTSSAHTNGHTNGTTNGFHNGTDDRLAGIVAAASNLQVEERAFVRVNFVSPGSPADAAGICVDDLILQFGSINFTNFNSLSQVGSLVQNSVGARVDVKLRRGEQVLTLALVPNVWEGRGLMGCNIVAV